MTPAGGNLATATLAVLGRAAAGIGVSILPRRHWSRWDVPAEAFSTISAVLTIATGILAGLGGFLRYAARVANAGISLPAPQDAWFDPAMALSMFSVFAFALATPLGLVCTYLVVSGVTRSILVAAGTSAGDPLLTAIDTMVKRRTERRAEDREVALRHAREGPAVPDVLVTGEEAGMPGSEWVVISSRLKPGWDPGVFVVTTERWYRLGSRDDRQTPDGLRAYYPLEAVAAAEVIRRSVYYDHPRLSALHPARTSSSL